MGCIMTLIRSIKEEDYFTQLIYEALKSLEEEIEKLSEFNYIRCPKCGMHLKKIYYNGINADKCLQCDGI